MNGGHAFIRSTMRERGTAIAATVVMAEAWWMLRVMEVDEVVVDLHSGTSAGWRRASSKFD